MGSRYIKITPKEFEEFMKVFSLNCFTPPPGVLGREKVYTLYWGQNNYMLKVYSSIVPGIGSRKKGADAIRVVLFAEVPSKGMFPVWKAKRVNRTMNWRKNLSQRIEEAFFRGCKDCNWECEMCGSPMLIRDGWKGQFYGCTNYPRCRFTFSV
jgi:hypothetical protein